MGTDRQTGFGKKVNYIFIHTKETDFVLVFDELFIKIISAEFLLSEQSR